MHYVKAARLQIRGEAAAPGTVPRLASDAGVQLAVLIALVHNGVIGALLVHALIVAVQQFEGNVPSPWLQSKSMNLHATVVRLSVTLGSTLFGITGAFLAVPAAAVSAVLLRYLDEVVERRSTPLMEAARCPWKRCWAPK
jgi:predicted PurR-regulated permease PerM